MSEPQFAIQIEKLCKHFKKQQVLREVNLDVPRGSIFGFLGLNGAGKTTLIRILLGLSPADSGRCLVDGIDPSRNAIGVRGRVGYMAENQTMYGWMRVDQLVGWVSRFYPDWDSEYAGKLLEQMRFEPGARVGSLSKGQTSRLALLLALAHRPGIVILDDPTLGLDPIARRDLLRDIIGQLQERGATVFFSSHLLYEIEPICDRVAVLHEGRILRCATVDELRERVKRVVLKPVAGARLPDVPGLLDVQAQDSVWSVTLENVEAARPALRAISQGEWSVLDLNLDEIFEAYVIGRKELTHA